MPWREYKEEMKERQMKPIAALTGWQQGEFVPVGRSYGGYQGWLCTELSEEKAVRKFYADRACGVTAATNAALYLAEYHREKAGLFSGRCADRRNYTERMREVFAYIRPHIWGIPFLSSLASRFRRFARSRGIELVPQYFRLSWGSRQAEEAAAFIAGGLRRNTPVLLLTWNIREPELQDLKYHWVTVTALYQEQDEYFVVTSNWGMKKIYSLSRWAQAGSLYRGLVYFV